MVEEKFSALYPQLDEVGSVIKFGRKKIINSVKESVSQIESELSDLKLGIEALTNEYNSLNSELYSVEEMGRNEKKKHQLTQVALQKTKDVYFSLRQKHDETSTKHELICSILSAQQVGNDFLDDFRRLVNSDFLDFANEVSSLKDEAATILELQELEKKLELLVNFSDIANKNMIAVGGGFSAGKSEFISSFFENTNIKLPIGIKPVTAIPTYIISGENEKIKGYSIQGGETPISSDLYLKLSHDFVKSFKFNIKDIMPVMAIETPIKEYPFIGFVDTPGYNPSQTEGYTNQDSETSEEFLTQSKSLIWVIGVDSNGTIGSSDVEFLQRLQLVDKNLYIVVNKADLKSKDDLEDIVDSIAETLEDEDINYIGISAYSSVLKEEVLYQKKCLQDFLNAENKTIDVADQVNNQLNSVISKYKVAIKDDIEEREKCLSSINSLKLDLLQSGCELSDDNVNERLNIIEEKFQTKSLKKQLSKLDQLNNNMRNAVNGIFKHIYGAEFEKKF